MEGITDLNWIIKKRKLVEMLDVIAETERVYYDSNKRMKTFAAITTLRGWRISVKSTISLVEELYTENFSVVLTGMFNQDAHEVIKIGRISLKLKDNIHAICL